MRLFIAIELPDEILSELEKLQPNLETDIAKQTISKQHHLTLKFLGDTDKLEEIKEALKKVNFNPYQATLGNIGVFPDENYVKVVWIGIEPEEETIRLKQDIDKALEGFNFKDNFDFHPHITLSRVKFIKTKENFKKILNSISPRPLTFKVSSFKLIRSELTPEGPLYTILASFPL